MLPRTQVVENEMVILPSQAMAKNASKNEEASPKALSTKISCTFKLINREYRRDISRKIHKRDQKATKNRAM